MQICKSLNSLSPLIVRIDTIWNRYSFAIYDCTCNKALTGHHTSVLGLNIVHDTGFVCSKKVVTQSGDLTVGVERVNGTQLTTSVRYTTVELPANITIGQLTFQPALIGVHYTDTADSLTFTTSAVSCPDLYHTKYFLNDFAKLYMQTSEDIPLNIINPEIILPLAFNVTITTSEPQ